MFYNCILSCVPRVKVDFSVVSIFLSMLLFVKNLLQTVEKGEHDEDMQQGTIGKQD